MSAEDALGRQFGTFQVRHDMLRAKLDVEPEYPGSFRRGKPSGPPDKVTAATRMLGAGRGYSYQQDMVRKGIKISPN